MFHQFRLYKNAKNQSNKIITIIVHNQQQNIIIQKSVTLYQFSITLTIHKRLKFNNNSTIQKLTTLHQIT